jgi:hypothetical protein
MMSNKSQFRSGRGAKRFGSPQQTPRAVFELQSALRQALAFHGGGQLGEAEKGYLKIMQVQPDHFDSLHMLGVVYDQRGNHAEAVRQIDVALKTRSCGYCAAGPSPRE